MFVATPAGIETVIKPSDVGVTFIRKRLFAVRFVKVVIVAFVITMSDCVNPLTVSLKLM